MQVMAMGNDKKHPLYGAAIIVFILTGCFTIYFNFFAQKRFQLPDSSDRITSISIYDGSLWYGTNCKEISNQTGIEHIIDVLQQVEIDYSSPENRGAPAGGSSLEFVLHYEDGTDNTICVLCFGGDKIVIGPEFTDGYYGTWPDAEIFFWNLDYPVIHLSDGELGRDSYKGPDI